MDSWDRGFLPFPTKSRTVHGNNKQWPARSRGCINATRNPIGSEAGVATACTRPNAALEVHDVWTRECTRTCTRFDTKQLEKWKDLLLGNGGSFAIFRISAGEKIRYRVDSGLIFPGEVLRSSYNEMIVYDSSFLLRIHRSTCIRYSPFPVVLEVFTYLFLRESGKFLLLTE